MAVRSFVAACSEGIVAAASAVGKPSAAADTADSCTLIAAAGVIIKRVAFQIIINFNFKLFAYSLL